MELTIQKWVVSSNQECTHIVSDETGEAVIIDCGVYYADKRKHLLEYIEKEQLKPVHLLLTHLHYNHIYGDALILERYGLLPEIHEAEKDYMIHIFPIRIKEIYGDNYPYTKPISEKTFKGGDIISLESHQLKVIHTPWHSPSSEVFSLLGRESLFYG